MKNILIITLSLFVVFVTKAQIGKESYSVNGNSTVLTSSCYYKSKFVGDGHQRIGDVVYETMYIEFGNRFINFYNSKSKMEFVLKEKTIDGKKEHYIMFDEFGNTRLISIDNRDDQMMYIILFDEEILNSISYIVLKKNTK